MCIRDSYSMGHRKWISGQEFINIATREGQVAGEINEMLAELDT